MGCCTPNKTPIISNTIPHPEATKLNEIHTKPERPSLRRQAKLQKMQGLAQPNDTKITQNVSIIDGTDLKRKSENYLSQTLKSHFFFHNMSQYDRKEIIKQMCLCKAEPGTYIFKQNDLASAFFIIDQGSVQVEIGGIPKKTLSRGSYFGELALLYASPRSASIKVLEPTRCWCIARWVFRKTMQQILQRNYGFAKAYINRMPIFGFLTEAQKDSIAYSMFVLKYEDGQIIYKQNDDANSFFIISSGKVQISVKNKLKQTLIHGDSFGQQSFKECEIRNESAISYGQTLCLSVGRDAIKNILGGQISSIIYYNISKWSIKRSQHLSKLTNIQIEKLLSLCQYKFYNSGQKIFELNSSPNKIAIVLQGKVNGLAAGTLIGQQFFQTYLVETVPRNFVKQTSGMIAEITFFNICNVTNKSLEQIINRPITSCHGKRMEELIPLSDYSYIKMQNLMFLKKLGEGQFGKVYLVNDKTSNQKYAVKCITKEQVVSNKMQKIMIQEKNILQLIDFGFLLKFYRTFKDDKIIFLLTQYIKGSELFDIIREIGLLSKTIARFYISSIILAIEYLHLKAIIYRDLKPQNIMVENDGYLKLIDMGTAKQLNQNNGFRTFTIIGTPHYMAPEVMAGKGYSFSSDIWTIGIMLYEFLCGQLPFGEQVDDPFAVHNAIVNNSLKYPSFMNDGKARLVIQQLLTKAPDSRLPKGFAALKALSYFDGFDWQQLYQKKMKSPYIPKKAKIPDRGFPEGTPFTSIMAKQKLKIKIPKQSKIPNWDEVF